VGNFRVGAELYPRKLSAVSYQLSAIRSLFPVAAKHTGQELYVGYTSASGMLRPFYGTQSEQSKRNPWEFK